MSALNGFLQNHANGCDFYESGFTDYCTCGRFEARQEYKMLLVRIAELTVENTRLQKAVDTARTRFVMFTDITITKHEIDVFSKEWLKANPKELK